MQLGLGGTIDRGSVEDDPAELVCAEKMREEEVQKLLHMCFDSDSEYAAYLGTPYPTPVPMKTVHTLME